MGSFYFCGECFVSVDGLDSLAVWMFCRYEASGEEGGTKRENEKRECNCSLFLSSHGYVMLCVLRYQVRCIEPNIPSHYSFYRGISSILFYL